MELRSAIDCAPILREFGASVGPNATIFGPLHIMNAGSDFSALTIGRDVYIGTDVLIDLADRVTIGDFISIGMRSNLITSFDVGPGPLSERRPRKQGPITLEDGCYVGTAVTILHGVTIGAEATVGAHALVRKDVPPHATIVAPEPRPLA
jgi:acetyltransferase-like isoleucine patch superfamily enzyme